MHYYFYYNYYYFYVPYTSTAPLSQESFPDLAALQEARAAEHRAELKVKKRAELAAEREARAEAEEAARLRSFE
jgi:hypothetical protein